MSQGIEINRLSGRSLEGSLQSLVEQNREPFFIDALEHRAKFLGRFLLFRDSPRQIVRCVIPPEGAVSGEWSPGKCEFFSRDHKPLGNGDLIVLHPEYAAKLMQIIKTFKAGSSNPTPLLNQ
ncbi:MAG: hypothetical protein M1372_02785 [Patescibacteria group bacterium]|nr:hypothetical protein [Patescibacteria group bacterium]